MTNAIIRHRNSGECFTAVLDESGDSGQRRHRLDADTEPWEDDDDRSAWTAEHIAVVHQF